MATTSYPFDNQMVSENEFSKMFTYLQDTGVAPGGLATSADSSGMTVKVGAGDAFVRGHFFTSSGQEALPITASGPQPRIDTVLLRLDAAENSIVLACKPGAPAASPAPPTLVQTATGIYEFPLSDVAVPANAVTIAASNVTDRRTWIGARIRPWTSATRPTNPTPGLMGLNTDLGAIEFRLGSDWVTLGNLSGPFGGGTIHRGDAAPANSLGSDGDIYFEF